MPEQTKGQKKLKFHGGFYRGKSAYLDFWIKGQRYTECLGPVAPSVARECATKRKAEIIQNRLGIGPHKHDNMTFRDFVDSKYLPFYETNRKASTVDRGRRILRVLVNEFGSITLRNISHNMVEEFKQRLIGRALAPATVNQHLAIMQGALQRAIEWGYIGVNPLHRVEMLPVHNARVRFLTDIEEKVLLAALPDRVRKIAILGINTGLRQTELLSLRWKNVNFDTGLITVEAAYSKNHASRSVPMNAAVRNLLKAMQGNQALDDKIFVLGRSQVGRIFHAAVLKAGIPDCRFHDLRHTFASRLVMRGIDIRTVQDLMGHNLLIMTMRYSHLSAAHRQKAVDILDNQA